MVQGTAIKDCILKTYRRLKNDYLNDPFKYLSEADVVYSYANMLTQHPTVQGLIDSGLVEVHFECRPLPNMGQADLLVMLQEGEEQSIHSVIEFKVRVNGNKERCIQDFQDVERLRQEGIEGYVFVFDRCALLSQLEAYLGEAEEKTKSELRGNILWTCDHDTNGSLAEVPNVEMTHGETEVVMQQAATVLTSIPDWQISYLSEADIVFEVYRQLVNDGTLAKFFERRALDVHCEIRPYYESNGLEYVSVKDKARGPGFFWVAQKLKNQGARVDLSITARNGAWLRKAESKAFSDQGGKMKYWRILSHPIENILLFSEFKKTANIKDDILKLKCLHGKSPSAQKYIVSKQKGRGSEMVCYPQLFIT